MRLLIVELDDKDMALLEAVARSRHTDPGVLVKTEVLKALLKIRNSTLEDRGKTQEARRLARIAALLPSSGIWAGEAGTMKDGVAYQEKMRAEWP